MGVCTEEERQEITPAALLLFKHHVQNNRMFAVLKLLGVKYIAVDPKAGLTLPEVQNKPSIL